MPDLNINIAELDPRADVLASDNYVSVRAREGGRVSAQQLSNFTNIDYVLSLAPQSIQNDSVLKLVNDTNNTAFQIEVEDLADFLVDATIFAASETRRGVAEIATSTEVQAGTDNTRMVSPAGLASLTSTTFRAGLIETATFTEVNTGTDGSRAITPASLSQRTATETRTGLIRLATDLEVFAGVADNLAVTPLTLDNKRATTSVFGLVRFATSASTNSGVADNLAVTPAGLSDRVATEGVRGLIELATTSEGNAGVDGFRAMTPSTTRAAIDFRVPIANTLTPGKVELATNTEAIAGTDTARAVTPAGLNAAINDRGRLFNPFLDPNTSIAVDFNNRPANNWFNYQINVSGIEPNTWYMAKITARRPQNNGTYYYRRVGSAAGANYSTQIAEITGNSIGSSLTVPIFLDANRNIQLRSNVSAVGRILDINLLGFYS